MDELEVIKVSKQFGPSIVAVRDVSLTVEAGEIMCLLGPSGCGKTTLLRMIAGLETPDAGVIRFGGRDVTQVPPHLREFGMMFQDFALFPHKNVFGNVAFGLRMHRLPPDEIAVRVSEMLALVDLDGSEERDISRMSGGEQQRVALARSLAPNPQLLLLDEPLGALDRVLRERLVQDVRIILKRVGITTIYVTHDQTEAFAVSDRVAVMNAGRVEQIARPEVVFARPATPFVARFLGYRNQLNGQVTESGDVLTAIGRFRPDFAVPPAGTPVTLLIKPYLDELMMPGTEPAADDLNVIRGTIEMASFRGRFTQLWIAVAGRTLVFEIVGESDVQQGQTVIIRVSSEQLQLYEPTVEKSVAD